MRAKRMSELILDGGDWLINWFPDEKRLARSRGVRGVIDTMRLFSGEQTGVVRTDYAPQGWLRGSVPGDVRDVLLAHGVIPDPYVGRNNELSRWVENFAWWFRKTFAVPDAWRGRRLELRFEGIDYKADFYLNGRRIGRHEGMFTPAVFDVTEAISFDGENVLCVGFAPPPQGTADHYWDGRIPERARHHRCQMSWGWDWARHLMPIGIWDSVRLTAHQDVRLTDVFVRTRRRSGERWDVCCEVEIANDGAALRSADLTIELRGANLRTRSRRARWNIPLKRGTQRIRRVISVESPGLWWPNGYGEQCLYEAVVTVGGAGRTVAERRVRFGVREVRMSYNPQSPKDAYPLTFRVNGRRIFVRGGNWVPPDMIFARLNAERYRPLILQARDAHWNMLRVWGGGLVEKEAFYRLCDEHGILVWQEFLHSCSNYPKDRKYVAEKAREATHIIRRLRNHPCIALWCGGNEMQYYGEKPDSPVLLQYGRLVRKLHPGIGYHVSCPDKSREGERHHGPWTCRDHAFWNTHFRLFASEVGCNAMPDVASLRRFIPKEETFPFGPSYSYHFTLGEGPALEDKALAVCAPATLEQHVAASQLMQADSLRYLMEHYRRNMWKSSGCLIWQYNESWPTCAYSIVDYYGCPKAAYYWLKKACEPIHVSAKDEGWLLREKRFTAEVWVSNDTPHPLRGMQVLAVLTDARGGVILVKRLCGDAPAETSVAVGTLQGDVGQARNENPLVLTLDLRHGGRVVSRQRVLYTTEDFRGIFERKGARLCARLVRMARAGEEAVIEAAVSNSGSRALFGVEVRVAGVPPERVRRDDSRFILLPGESRSIMLRAARAEFEPARRGVRVEADAWNSPSVRATAR